MRAFRQLLDGHGNSLGDLKPEPRPREDDHQREAHDQRDVLRLDGILVGHGFFEVLIGVGDAVHFRHQGLRQERVHDDNATHLGRVRGRRNGHGGADQIPGLDELERLDLAAGQGVFHELVLGSVQDREGNLRIH